MIFIKACLSGDSENESYILATEDVMQPQRMDCVSCQITIIVNLGFVRGKEMGGPQVEIPFFSWYDIDSHCKLKWSSGQHHITQNHHRCFQDSYAKQRFVTVTSLRATAETDLPLTQTMSYQGGKYEALPICLKTHKHSRCE